MRPFRSFARQGPPATPGRSLQGGGAEVLDAVNARAAQGLHRPEAWAVITAALPTADLRVEVLMRVALGAASPAVITGLLDRPDLPADTRASFAGVLVSHLLDRDRRWDLTLQGALWAMARQGLLTTGCLEQLLTSTEACARGGPSSPPDFAARPAILRRLLPYSPTLGADHLERLVRLPPVMDRPELTAGFQSDRVVFDPGAVDGLPPGSAVTRRPSRPSGLAVLGAPHTPLTHPQAGPGVWEAAHRTFHYTAGADGTLAAFWAQVAWAPRLADHPRWQHRLQLGTDDYTGLLWPWGFAGLLDQPWLAGPDVERLWQRHLDDGTPELEVLIAGVSARAWARVSPALRSQLLVRGSRSVRLAVLARLAQPTTPGAPPPAPRPQGAPPRL